MFRVALVAFSFLATGLAVQAADPAVYFRMPAPLLASSSSLPPPITVFDPDDGLPRRADVIRPRFWVVAGVDGVDYIAATTEGVINRLYDHTLATSAINWFAAAPAGSQQLSLEFTTPVMADGCDVNLQSHKDKRPSIGSVRFQYQDANNIWSAWTPALGNFDTTKSGNRAFSGRCGIPEGGTLVKALRLSAPEDFPGEVWIREFRVSLAGVSAP